MDVALAVPEERKIKSKPKSDAGSQTVRPCVSDKIISSLH